MAMLRSVHPGPACDRLLNDDAQALAGFPVRPLVQAWLTQRAPAGARIDADAGRLLRELLLRWTTELNRQLVEMAHCGSLALEHGCQRTRASHAALHRLLAVVDQAMAADGAPPALSSRFTAPVAGSGQIPPVAAHMRSARSATRAVGHALSN
jgi:hypothetical protein